MAARQRKFEGAIMLKAKPMRETAPRKRAVINPKPQPVTAAVQLVRSVM